MLGFCQVAYFETHRRARFREWWCDIDAFTELFRVAMFDVWSKICNSKSWPKRIFTGRAPLLFLIMKWLSEKYRVMLFVWSQSLNEELLFFWEYNRSITLVQSLIKVQTKMYLKHWQKWDIQLIWKVTSLSAAVISQLFRLRVNAPVYLLGKF